MQELQVFITDQYRLLSNQIDDRLLNKRFDDVIQEQRESRGVIQPTNVVLETTDTNIGKPEINKKEDNAQPKQQATARNSSNHQKNPIQQTNIEYKYSIGTKRHRPNKNKEKEEIPDVAMPYESLSPDSVSNGTTLCEFLYHSIDNISRLTIICRVFGQYCPVHQFNIIG
ncbi:hypothetical protein SEVIR_2G155933v4 [Setaria viridis]